MSTTPTPKPIHKYKYKVPNFGKALEKEYPPVKSTTTQNDWERRFHKRFNFKKGQSISWYANLPTDAKLDDVLCFIRKELADARKEECRQRLFTIDGLKKTCGICGVIKETAFHKDASQSHDGCENNYNKAIDDVLTTLRKEQG